jgi:hypothetical protein
MPHISLRQHLVEICWFLKSDKKCCC